MQHRAIRLMASKLAVAGIIEGNFTDEGLAAMSDCADMTTALARELTQGIKNEVEDLGAVFKKMAILKSETVPNQLAIEAVDMEFTDVDDLTTSGETLDITEIQPVTALYAPTQKGNVQSLGQVTVLHSLLQFKVADFPADFDPFAQEAA